MLWMVLPVLLDGATPLESARRAQAMLGAETWSRVIRVENRGGRGAYPATVDALVFEQGGILWFYTATEGTQSLSLYRNRLVVDKADLGPLLKAIDPGFVRFEVLPDAAEAARPVGNPPLANGCFIECLATLREKILRGDRVERPRLLSCYASTPEGLSGHTVLTYETPEGFFLLDPAVSVRPRAVPRLWKNEPLVLASVVMEGASMLRARWVPVDKISVPIVAKRERSRTWDEIPAPQVMQ